MKNEEQLKQLLKSMSVDEQIKFLLKSTLELQDTYSQKNFISIHNQEVFKLCINTGVSLLHVNGDNLIYNMKYREKISEMIKSSYFANKSNRSNGVDLDATPPAECKSYTYKQKKIVIQNNLSIGEIDKVYNKKNNSDSKYSTDTKNHAFFSLYKKASGIPFLTFYVNNTDFGKTVQPLINKKFLELELKSNYLTKASRDSLALKLGDFKDCLSLDIADLDKSETVYVSQAFLDELNHQSQLYKKIKDLIKTKNIIVQ